MTLTQLAEAVGKSVPAVITIQRKYGLSTYKDYSDGYAVLLRKIMYLEVFSVSKKNISEILQQERSLLELLKVDSVHDGPDWFESACTMKTGAKRLLLSGYDMGHAVTSESVQTGLDFKARAKNLFSDGAMGIDALRVLKRYAGILDKVRERLAHEQAFVRDAMKWTRRASR